MAETDIAELDSLTGDLLLAARLDDHGGEMERGQSRLSYWDC